MKEASPTRSWCLSGRKKGEAAAPWWSRGEATQTSVRGPSG